MAIVKNFPKPLKLKRLIGPSFLIVATGIGSGEIILWPYLTSNYGLGLIWLALIGITFQYFINMEIERYTLVKGESVFSGLNKIFKWAPYWLIFSTFFTFAIPGTAAASAQLIGHLFNLSSFKFLGISILIIMGLFVSLGKTVYNTLEKFMKYTLFIFIPLITIFVIYISTTSDFSALVSGFVGQGEGYSFIPAGIVFATLFGAFAYSGSGGNLNLSQSSYIREKGYGMGKYSQKIRGFLHKDYKTKERFGEVTFKPTKENIKRFRKWWKNVSLEHFIVFWGIGLLMIIVFMMLSYVTSYGVDTGEGIGFVINQAVVVGNTVAPILGVLFLIIMAVFLFQSQLGIYDSSTRIITENIAVKAVNKSKKINLSSIYQKIVWFQILLGILMFLFNYYEPKTLITLAAILNAVGMFIHIGLVNYMNFKVLPKPFQASIFRKVLMVIIFLTFGVFCVITFITYL